MKKNTKEKILEAATEVFIEKGFSGASISEIAQLADINQSLIYHHIGSKESLWREVKKNLLKGLEVYGNHYVTFEDFLQEIIEKRIQLYTKDSRIQRLIQWQNLEETDEIIGANQIAPNNWTDIISNLQNKGEIKKDYAPNLIMVYIHSLINGAIYDSFKLFSKQPDLKNAYIEMIKTEIIKTFSCN